MKLLKFLLRKIFHLLLILTSIVLVIWLMWSLISQIDLRNIFNRGKSASSVLPLKPGKPQTQLVRKSGGTFDAAEKRTAASDAPQNPSVKEALNTVSAPRAPASSAVPETVAKEIDGKSKENIVSVTANKLMINGKTVKFKHFCEFITKVDKKTKVCFYSGYSADIYELVKKINNKHVSIFFDNR